MSKQTPARTPLASVECTHIDHGRRVLAARYPSSRTGVADHIATIRDDGTVVECSCDGWQGHGKCWHTESTTAYFAIGTYHIGEYARLTPEQVRAEISSKELYLSHQPDESDRAACDLELIALCLIDARKASAA